MNGREINKYFFLAAVLLLVFFSYLILKPYFIALISGFILAYLSRPVFTRLEKRMKSSSAALLTIFLVLLIIILPVGIVVAGVTQQAYKFVAQGGSLGEILQGVRLSPQLENLRIDLEVLDRVSDFFLSYAAGFVLSVPSFLVSLLVLLFAMFYILVDWEKLTIALKKSIPFQNKENLGKDIARITNILVYGTLLIAFIEFVISAIGFYFLGVGFFLLWAVLIFFLAFIPAAGPALIWIPMTIYYFIIGEYFTAIGILIIGVALSFFVDTVLRAKILGDKARINPLLMILGILGGISVFGVFGFIVGPLILAYTLEILEEIRITGSYTKKS